MKKLLSARCMSCLSLPHPSGAVCGMQLVTRRRQDKDAALLCFCPISHLAAALLGIVSERARAAANALFILAQSQR